MNLPKSPAGMDGFSGPFYPALLDDLAQSIMTSRPEDSLDLRIREWLDAAGELSFGGLFGDMQLDDGYAMWKLIRMRYSDVILWLALPRLVDGRFERALALFIEGRSATLSRLQLETITGRLIAGFITSRK